MILCIDNGAIIAAVAVGSFSLNLSSCKRLMIKVCYFVPEAIRNLIFVFVLAQDGYEFIFCKDFYNILLDKIMITKALLINGLYDLHVDAEIINNEQSMNIINKRHLKDNYKYL